MVAFLQICITWIRSASIFTLLASIKVITLLKLSTTIHSISLVKLNALPVILQLFELITQTFCFQVVTFCCPCLINWCRASTVLPPACREPAHLVNLFLFSCARWSGPWMFQTKVLCVIYSGLTQMRYCASTFELVDSIFTYSGTHLIRSPTGQ